MNAFLEFAEKNTPARQRRAAEKRRAKAAEKELAERSDLLRLWKRWRHERFDALLAGPHGVTARELVDFLQSLTLDDEARLLELVRTAGWARVDANTRFEVLSLVNAT